MIKIIKEGNPGGISIYQNKCSKCGCVFEFNSEDREYHRGLSMSEFGIPSYYTIDCPQCKTTFRISDLIPIRHD